MSETEAAKPDAEPEKEADHHPYRRPVDAATLILIDRTGATPKVLVGKRHDKVVFQPGKIVFEIVGVPEELAREAFRLAAAKLPLRTTFVARQLGT